MTARTIAEEKRIICDSCDIGSINSEEDNAEGDVWLLCAEYCYLEFVLPLHICNASRLPAKVASATWYGRTTYWTNSRVQSAVINLYQKHSTSWSHFRTPRWVR
ncbi:hypothetical protein P692DRAFT_20827486 [Suillus brevipes Sb2]|nr:hypothetical protein P692DRAFT_20827486 [Suillus brevipes Sb2]